MLTPKSPILNKAIELTEFADDITLKKNIEKFVDFCEKNNIKLDLEDIKNPHSFAYQALVFAIMVFLFQEKLAELNSSTDKKENIYDDDKKTIDTTYFILKTFYQVSQQYSHDNSFLNSLLQRLQDLQTHLQQVQTTFTATVNNHQQLGNQIVELAAAANAVQHTSIVGPTPTLTPLLSQLEPEKDALEKKIEADKSIPETSKILIQFADLLKKFFTIDTQAAKEQKQISALETTYQNIATEASKRTSKVIPSKKINLLEVERKLETTKKMVTATVNKVTQKTLASGVVIDWEKRMSYNPKTGETSDWATGKITKAFRPINDDYSNQSNFENRF